MWRPATAGVQFPRQKERERASHLPSGIDACPNPDRRPEVQLRFLVRNHVRLAFQPQSP
jgi:hypothetical protein